MQLSLRPPEFIVNPEDLFANDRLNRSARVESLCRRVLMKDTGTLVVAVDGGFGGVRPALALRTVDRQAYDDLIAGKCDGFPAAAAVRDKLNILPSENGGVHLMGLLISIGDDPNFDLTEDNFCERFIAAGAGDAEFSNRAWHIWDTQIRRWILIWKLSQLDDILDLLN